MCSYHFLHQFIKSSVYKSQKTVKNVHNFSRDQEKHLQIHNLQCNGTKKSSIWEVETSKCLTFLIDKLLQRLIIYQNRCSPSLFPHSTSLAQPSQVTQKPKGNHKNHAVPLKSTPNMTTVVLSKLITSYSPPPKKPFRLWRIYTHTHRIISLTAV